VAFPSPDTDPRAHQVQLAIYRRMSGGERVALALALSEAVRETARAGIRARHPDYGDDDVERALRKLLYGEALVRRAWPAEPVRDP
jgi:hypothetical protein